MTVNRALGDQHQKFRISDRNASEVRQEEGEQKESSKTDGGGMFAPRVVPSLLTILVPTVTLADRLLVIARNLFNIRQIPSVTPPILKVRQ